MKLDLEKVHYIMNKLAEKQSELSEENVYVHLLGHSSQYSEMSFEGFLNYYSFRLNGDEIIIFNDDSVAWESYTNNDFSYIPSVLISFSDEQLNSWIETEIRLQLAKQEREKVKDKENIKAKIKHLQKQLKTLH